jgi:hypothetical protein
MFAPRIHERYLYYPVIFLIPIALQDGVMTTIFTAISATFLFNLLYIKQLTDTSTYFPDHPNAALVVTALINLTIFLSATTYGLLKNPSSRSPQRAATSSPAHSADAADSASA